MYPLLIDHKDSVYITFPTKLKKYDVVLFRRNTNQLVLHRILKIKGSKVTMCGDNEFQKEVIDKSQIIGKMSEFSHNNKITKVTSLKFKLYSRFFCLSFPTKKFLFFIIRIRNHFKRKCNQK
ncbi:putative uncharacterized protein [Eubacterium sp. CAG:581]|nr:putative uncharacterized protein [Eubacterium sp. CAG:581]